MWAADLQVAENEQDEAVWTDASVERLQQVVINEELFEYYDEATNQRIVTHLLLQNQQLTVQSNIKTHTQVILWQKPASILN